MKVDTKILTKKKKNNTTKARYTSISPTITRLTQVDPKFQASREDIVAHYVSKINRANKMPWQLKALSKQT